MIPTLRHDLLVTAVRVAFGAALGGAMGVVFFAALRRNVELYAARGHAARAVAAHVLRLVAAALVFYLAARVGPAALIAALGAFLVARSAAIRGMRTAP